MSAQRVLFDSPGPRARRRHTFIAVIGGLLLAGTAAALLMRLQERGQLTAAKWQPFLTSAPWSEYILPGMVDTLRAAAVAILIAMVLGLALAMGRMSDTSLVRWGCGVFVEFFRAVPVLIMILFTFFFLTYRSWTDDAWNPFIALVTGLTLYNSSVLCEVIRSGVASLPAGQREAGHAIGLSPSKTRRMILVPQALTAMMPALIGQLIVITKDSALGYIITYSELLTTTRQMGSRFANTLPAYIVAAVLFILINYAISKAAERVESRQRRRRHTAGRIPHADGVDLVGTGLGER